MYEVIYSSQSGNTKRIALAISEELGVEAKNVKSTDSLTEGADIFIGSGLYLLRPSKRIRKFIQNNNFHGKRVALFGTSTTGIGIETILMERLLRKKGAVIVGKFYCPGRFFLHIGRKILFIRKNRPSYKDLDKAREFAFLVGNRAYDTDNKVSENREGQHENRVLSRI
jgi:flavodoxin